MTIKGENPFPLPMLNFSQDHRSPSKSWKRTITQPIPKLNEPTNCTHISLSLETSGENPLKELVAESSEDAASFPLMKRPRD